MAGLAHPSNPLALAVLALLFERPMHPYEMAATLKQRALPVVLIYDRHNSLKLTSAPPIAAVAQFAAAGG
jgi:hypothetical protein